MEQSGKNKIDYSITPISFYRFCCDDVSIQSCYVGHTANFRTRKSKHKSDCNNPTGKSYNLKIYQTIRENGGWGNWKMVEIENKICGSKRDAERHEQTLAEELKANMNMKKAFGAENIIEYQKQYYKEHADEKKKYQAEYYKEHADEIKKYQADYQAENADEIKKYQAQYRAKKKKSQTDPNE